MLQLKIWVVNLSKGHARKKVNHCTKILFSCNIFILLAQNFFCQNFFTKFLGLNFKNV